MLDHSHHPIDQDWQHRASCRGTDTAIFFPDGERGSVRARREHAAKQICHTCPVLAECRDHALTTTEAYGIWGGMSETERARHAARPPVRVWERRTLDMEDPNTHSTRTTQLWPPTTVHRESP